MWSNTWEVDARGGAHHTLRMFNRILLQRNCSSMTVAIILGAIILKKNFPRTKWWYQIDFEDSFMHTPRFLHKKIENNEDMFTLAAIWEVSARNEDVRLMRSNTWEVAARGGAHYKLRMFSIFPEHHCKKNIARWFIENISKIFLRMNFVTDRRTKNGDSCISLPFQ